MDSVTKESVNQLSIFFICLKMLMQKKGVSNEIRQKKKNGYLAICNSESKLKWVNSLIIVAWSCCLLILCYNEVPFKWSLPFYKRHHEIQESASNVAITE